MMNDNYYTSGKQYQVKCSSVITPENKGKVINFDLVFETIEIPFAESIGTSLDLENKPNKALWSNDMLVPLTKKVTRELILLLTVGIIVFIITEMFLIMSLNFTKSNNHSR